MKHRLDSQLAKLASDQVPAFIIGSGSSNDLSFIRSLGRRKIPTVHFVADRLLGSFSRYGVRLRMPPVEENPQTWLELLESAARLVGPRPVLFALSDAHIAFLSENADRLNRSFRFLLPDPTIVGQILDKRQQYNGALAAGIRLPPTLYPEKVDAVAMLAPTLHYPLILKPHTPHIGRRQISNLKVVVVHSAAELVSAYSNCTASGARFMVQEIVAGKDEAIFWYSGYWDADGGERAWFTAQKLRQFPPLFGDGSFAQTVDAPIVRDASRRLLEHFCYHGLVMVEFKRDPRDASFNLMEINLRSASTNQLGIAAGVDLPFIAHSNLAGLDSPDTVSPPFQLNVKYVHEEWDVQAFVALRRAKELTFWNWIRSMSGTRAWGLFAWDDPLPLLVGVWRFIRIGLQNALAR